MKYRVKGIKGNVVLVQIIEQKYRGKEFNGGCRDFVFGDVILKSDQFPCCSKHTEIIFVRGKDKEKDMNIIEIPLMKYKNFEEAVKAYNKWENVTDKF